MRKPPRILAKLNREVDLTPLDARRWQRMVETSVVGISITLYEADDVVRSDDAARDDHFVAVPGCADLYMGGEKDGPRGGRINCEQWRVTSDEIEQFARSLLALAQKARETGVFG